MTGAAESALDFRILGPVEAARDGQVIYSAIASFDGYVADEDGNFDWAEPPDAPR